MVSFLERGRNARGASEAHRATSGRTSRPRMQFPPPGLWIDREALRMILYPRLGWCPACRLFVSSCWSRLPAPRLSASGRRIPAPCRKAQLRSYRDLCPPQIAKVSIRRPDARSWSKRSRPQPARHDVFHLWVRTLRFLFSSRPFGGVTSSPLLPSSPASRETGLHPRRRERSSVAPRRRRPRRPLVRLKSWPTAHIPSFRRRHRHFDGSEIRRSRARATSRVAPQPRLAAAYSYA
jgi:hypothetical protein